MSNQFVTITQLTRALRDKSVSLDFTRASKLYKKVRYIGLNMQSTPLRIALPKRTLSANAMFDGKAQFDGARISFHDQALVAVIKQLTQYITPMLKKAPKPEESDAVDYFKKARVTELANKFIQFITAKGDDLEQPIIRADIKFPYSSEGRIARDAAPMCALINDGKPVKTTYSSINEWIYTGREVTFIISIVLKMYNGQFVLGASCDCVKMTGGPRKMVTQAERFTQKDVLDALDALDEEETATTSHAPAASVQDTEEIEEDAEQVQDDETVEYDGEEPAPEPEQEKPKPKTRVPVAKEQQTAAKKKPAATRATALAKGKAKQSETDE